MRGAKLPAFRSTSFPLDWTLDWGLDWELYSATGNPFEELLLNCGGLVGNYGQSVRELEDMQAVSFDGSSQYVETGITSVDYSSIDWEIDVALSISTLEDNCPIVSQANGGGIGRSFIEVLGVSGEVVTLLGNGSVVSSGLFINIGEWSHVSLKKVGSIYTMSLNGSESILPITSQEPANGEVYIARNKPASFFFNGSIAYASINGTIYNFQETSGSTVFDRSGGGNHATLINNPTRVVDNSAELAPYDTTNLDGYTDGTGSNGAAVGVRIPAQVGSTTLDALGNPLEYSGSAYPALPKRVDSVGRGFDGATQYVSLASLVGSETVTSWGGSGTEPTISAGRIDFTAGDYWELTLSNGVSIPMNNTGAYDLASDGSLVNYINNPTQVDQDVYHAELEQGFYKAVRMPFGGMRGGANLQTFTSFKFRFIVGDGFNRFFFGTRNFANPQRNIGGYITNTSRVSFQFGAESYTSPISITFNTGDEREIEMRSNGELLIDGVIVHTFSGTLNNVDDTEILLVGTNNNGTLSRTSHNHILLQAWVNGNDIDIYDTNNHVGTISTHRLVGYPELTNPPAGNGHNDADTKLNLTHLTPTGDRTPAIAASGQDIQAYTFGDTLTNPAFKRVVSADYEDRHSIFQEELTGECLSKAQDLYDI